MVSARSQKILLGVIVGLFFLLSFSPYHALMRNHYAADDASYLSHAFTLGLDFNLRYEGMIADWVAPSGRAPSHPIGAGLLASPFVAAFSVVDRMMGHPVIHDHSQFQYSWSLFGFVFASLFYFLLGLVLYAKSLENFKITLSRSHLTFIACSFGILFYVFFRPIMSHSFEFFTLALCLYSTSVALSVLNKDKRIALRSLFFLALSLVLTVMIRPGNTNIFLLPLIVLGAKISLFNAHYPPRLLIRFAVAFTGLLLVCFIPYVIINNILYGAWFPSSNEMYGVNVNPTPSIHSLVDLTDTLWILITRLPQLFVIAFSSEFGLAFTSSILFFGMLFLLYYLTLSVRKHIVWGAITLCCVAMYVGLPIAIIFFWQTLGDAYGYRFLFCLFPLSLLGYAIWQSKIRSTHLLRWALIPLCCYGILSGMLFGINDDLRYKPNQTNSFGKEWGSAVGYNTAVAKALPSMNSWAYLAASRTPGFLATGAFHAASIDIEAMPLPHAIRSKMEKFNESYTYPPIAVYVQTFILGWVFMLFAIRFCAGNRQDKTNYAV